MGVELPLALSHIKPYYIAVWLGYVYQFRNDDFSKLE